MMHGQKNIKLPMWSSLQVVC